MDPAKLRDGLRKAGLYVAEGDPVLELAAICEVSLTDTVKIIERVTKQQADRVTAASTQAVVDATKAAELLLTEAGAWAETRLKAAAETAAAMVVADIRQETAKVERASRAATRAAWATAFCAAVIVCGLAGMVLARVTQG